LNTGWLCISSKLYFGSFLTAKKLRTAALTNSYLYLSRCSYPKQPPNIALAFIIPISIEEICYTTQPLQESMCLKL